MNESIERYEQLKAGCSFALDRLAHQSPCGAALENESLAHGWRAEYIGEYKNSLCCRLAHFQLLPDMNGKSIEETKEFQDYFASDLGNSYIRQLKILDRTIPRFLSIDPDKIKQTKDCSYGLENGKILRAMDLGDYSLSALRFAREFEVLDGVEALNNAHSTALTQVFDDDYSATDSYCGA